MRDAAKRTAVSLLPVAITMRPNTVRCIRNQKKAIATMDRRTGHGSIGQHHRCRNCRKLLMILIHMAGVLAGPFDIMYVMPRAIVIMAGVTTKTGTPTLQARR